MSGIFGFYSKSGNAGEHELHALDIFNRSYGHEGSDTLLSGHMGAGCHLEHFSEEFSASAPVFENEMYIAVIDALLYNRDELIPELGGDESVSDEELLLELILHKGYPALATVNGDFSGAIYEKKTHTWTLFRDHSGVRPLFYYLDQDLFAFSTDMRGLTALPNGDMRINEKKFFERMAGYNDLTLCETEYENIRCVHPAAWMTVRQTYSGFETNDTIYFTWRQRKIRLNTDQEYQAELRRLITDSVKRRLDAVPGLVGCELSGGLDSSVIAILISRLGREGRFYSWSRGFDHTPMLEGRDERKVILDICKQENISCHFSKRDESRTVDSIIAELTVPYMNTYSLTQGSRYVKSEGCQVMFTGHGGDEGVSHRGNPYELWLHHEYFAFFRYFYRKSGKGLRWPIRMVKNLHYQFSEVHPHFAAPYHKFYSNPDRFLQPAFMERMKQGFEPKVHYFAFRPYKYIMQGGHRVRLDNISMQGAAAGVRYLAPYIDYRVLDYALSIPRAQFQNGYTNRYIFRAAFDDIMPQSLRDVHYKDTPSMDNYTPDIDLSQRYLEDKAKVMKYFDREYWADYFDLDAVDSFVVPKNYTRAQYANACYLLEDLMACCLIQRLPIETRKWSKSHE